MIPNAEIVLWNGSTDGYFALDLKRYPDGMPLMLAEGLPPAPSAMLVRPRDFHTLLVAMSVVDAYAWRGIRIPHLMIPCFPGARQDRLNPEGDYLFTAKTVANLINQRAFERVTVIDPHSDVVPALVDRCRVVRPHDFMKIPEGKYSAVISPDGGAEKRALGVAKALGVTMFHAWKTRDVKTGAINGFGLEPMVSLKWPPPALVVDDICDGGGTFLGLAKILAQREIKAHLYVTHGLFSQGTGKLLEAYSGHVYATDTLLAEAPGVIRIPVCERYLTA